MSTVSEAGAVAASATGDSRSVTILRAKLKRESVRRHTFRAWPYEAVVKGEDLARAGFFRIFTGDFVQCVFCLGRVGNWSPGDDAMAVHLDRHGDCPHASGTLCGNIPVEHEANLTPVDPPSDSEITSGFLLGVPRMAAPDETLSDDLRAGELFGLAKPGLLSLGRTLGLRIWRYVLLSFSLSAHFLTILIPCHSQLCN
jgi:baculoviral IAP repeat-containing protein 2/3/baculoviral IAP repeat-containing protein 7/8